MALNLQDFKSINELHPNSSILVFGYIRQQQKLLLPLSKTNIYYNIPIHIKKIISLFYIEREQWDRFVMICLSNYIYQTY